jgi:hypothetical protein
MKDHTARKRHRYHRRCDRPRHTTLLLSTFHFLL